MDNNEKIFHEKYNKILRRSNLYNKLYDFNKTPLVMSILVTNRCTLKCKHCFLHSEQVKHLDERDNIELSFSEYEKISKSMGTFMKAFFSGGEPFIRLDLQDIVLMFARNNNLTHISITTNGQLTDSIISQVTFILSNLNKNVHLSLGFSLDGFEDIHDSIRGNGSFKKCIETWEKCQILVDKYSNFDTYICSTINVLNEHEMSNFLQWCIDILVPSNLALLKVRQNPRDGEYLKDISLINYSNSMDVIKKATMLGKMGDRSDPRTYINAQICEYVYRTVSLNKRQFDCFAGKYGGFINFNGDVGVCEVLRPYDNLLNHQYDFKSLWNEMINKENMNYDHHECIACTHETEGIIPSLFFGNNKLDYIKKGNVCE